jgi:flagellar M-ring protein FliF
MRPLLRKVLTPESAPLALPVSAEIGMAGAPAMAMPPQMQQQMELQEEAPSSGPPRVPAWMNNAKSVGEVQAQTLKTVGTLVDENPKQAAVIVRDWLSSAA